MKFQKLALTGWSYDKGDNRVPLAELNLPNKILKRNPVEATYDYSDPSTWSNRLINHAKSAAKMAGVSNRNFQAFFGVHNGYQKHIEGASPVLAQAFPASNGFHLDFSLGCASIIMGAQLAGLHFSDENMHNIILGAVQMMTQYTDKYSDGNAIFADGIGALVFSKQTYGNLIRHTQIDSDGEFHDMFSMDEEAVYQIHNLHKGRDLTEFMVKAFSGQLRNSCVALKTIPKNIDYIAMSCSTHHATKTVLEAINFPLDQTGLECLTRVPHMGTNDLIFQIEHGIEQGLIKNGSKILMSGTSVGFSIATMALEWGVK